MNGTFNGQILVEKLAKLNITQQSIETLSHWCIFHRTKARQVVETWNEQFHCSPREQRLSFLYLANDILQTSRRKGSEFVGEFWKVLPDALSDVIENGDEFGRNAALRMINIWEERKVFGSQGKILKEQLMGRNLENINRNGKFTNIKPKQLVGNTLEKIISSYDVVYDGSVDEEALLTKCKTAVGYVEKLDKEIGSDYSSGKLDGSEFAELQGQRGILRECIEQLKTAESSRATLVSQIKEALEEQELRLDQVRTQLKAAQAQSEQAEKICQQLMNSNNGRLVIDQGLKETITFSNMPDSSFASETQAANGEEQSGPLMYTPRAIPLPNNSSSVVEEDSRKSAAAAVAAKLAASTSSAQMLTFALSSLASESMIRSQLNESPGGDYPAEKKAKIENGPTSYTQQPQHSQPPPPHFPHSDSLQNITATSQQLKKLQPPLLPPASSSLMSNPGPIIQQPPLTPVPPPPAQFMQTAGSMSSVPYSYGLSQQRPPPPLPSFSMSGPPPPTTGMPPFSSPNPYQNFQGSEGGGFYSQSPLPASPAISRQ